MSNEVTAADRGCIWMIVVTFVPVVLGVTAVIVAWLVTR